MRILGGIRDGSVHVPPAERGDTKRTIRPTGGIYGIIYGMKRTTVYLPDEIKAAVEREAARHRITEAEVIRRAIAEHLVNLGAPPPELPLFPDGLGVEIAMAGTATDDL